MVTVFGAACLSLQDLEGLLAAFDEERRAMGERHAAAEERATQLQAQVCHLLLVLALRTPFAGVCMRWALLIQCADGSDNPCAAYMTVARVRVCACLLRLLGPACAATTLLR